MKKCPFCQKQVPKFHKRSHLIPEWMYTECYDENHKIVNISLSKKHVNKKQKGYYADIICESCEKISQNYDRYGSVILTDRSPESTEKTSITIDNYSGMADGRLQDYSRWNNINFSRFQKFVFACVLRSDLAERKDGSYLLVDKHFNKMLELYHSAGSDDDTSYPICVNKITNTDALKKFMYMPFINRIDNHRVIEFAGSGYMFRVYVSSHKKEPCIYQTMLKADGTLYMLHFNLQEIGTFKGSLPILVDLANRFPNP